MTDMYSKNHKTVYERQGVVTNIASVPQGSPGRQSVACKIIKTAAAFAIAVLAATPASGQQTYGLRECVETGLRQNYSIRIVRGEEQITKNNAIPGNAGYLPSADLSGGYNGTLNDVRTRSAADGIVEKTGGVDNQTANAGLNINWTLFDGLGIQAEYARLKELRLMGELNTRLAVENLAADISAEYYNLIRQKTRLRNLRSTLGLSRERLRIVEERYSIGSMSRLDLQQAQVDFNADSSKVLNQLEMVHTSRTRLNELMALENVEAPIAIKDSLIYPDSLLSRNLLWESTERNNVSLLMSRKNYDISSLDLKKARSRNYPYLKLNGGYGYTGNWYGSGNTEYQQRLGFNYGLTLGINVFDGMNRRREQRNARIQMDNRSLAVQETELALRADMSNLWMAYRNNLNLWSLEKENLVAARENYDIALERYKLGDLAGIELREAQNSLLEAEERLSIAEYSDKICEISLLQLSGGILSYVFPDNRTAEGIPKER